MFALLNPRIWIALAIVAALALSHGCAYRSGKASTQAKWDAERAKQVIALAAATAAARTKEQSLQLKVTEAMNAATKRETTLRADVARVRAERDGLRNDLASTRQQLSSASPDSLRLRVSTLEDLLGQCIDRYSGVAEAADRSTSDALTLQSAWPK